MALVTAARIGEVLALPPGRGVTPAPIGPSRRMRVGGTRDGDVLPIGSRFPRWRGSHGRDPLQSDGRDPSTHMRRDQVAEVSSRLACPRIVLGPQPNEDVRHGDGNRFDADLPSAPGFHRPARVEAWPCARFGAGVHAALRVSPPIDLGHRGPVPPCSVTSRFRRRRECTGAEPDQRQCHRPSSRPCRAAAPAGTRTPSRTSLCALHCRDPLLSSRRPPIRRPWDEKIVGASFRKLSGV